MTKTIFKMAIRHLEFLKCSYSVMWLSPSSKSAVVYQISWKLEMIRKTLLAKAETTLVKRNTFCGTRVSVPVPKFCIILHLHAKFTEIWQSACWMMTKNDFQCGSCPPSWILKKCIWSSGCRLPNRMPHFVEIGWFFIEIWRYNDFSMAALSAISNFRNLEFVTRRLLPCDSAYLKSDKVIFKMVAIHHLEFLKSYLVMWLSSSSKSAVVY